MWGSKFAHLFALILNILVISAAVATISSAYAQDSTSRNDVAYVGGSCGQACGTDEVCAGGPYRSPDAIGHLECKSECVDPQSDRNHCGKCDSRCDTDEACVLGICEQRCAVGTPRLVGMPAGDCRRETDGTITCECCDEPGRDPEDTCGSCAPTYRAKSFFGPVDLDSFVDVPSELATFDEICEPIPTCDTLNCGPHGTCVDDAGPALCVDCEPGFAGETCEGCAPLYEPLGSTCVPSDDCDEFLCNGDGHCEEDEDGQLICDCDYGNEQPDGTCPEGPDIRIGGPVEAIMVGGIHRLGLELKNGAHCTTDFVWSVEDGTALVFVKADSKFADLEVPFIPEPLFDYVVVRAECGNNPGLFDTWEQTVLTTSAAVSTGTSAFSGTTRPEFEPIDDAMTTYMRRTQIEGGAIAITYRDQLVYLRAYGKRDVDADEDMLTCTPMRTASVTKSFTRAAMINGVYGLPIPGVLGGGTFGPNTPVVSILGPTMNLDTGGNPVFQAPASLYSATFPGTTCNPGSGAIDPGWLGVTPANILNHTSGLQPNANYASTPPWGLCTGAATESCGSIANVNDPTVSLSNTTGIANSLGLSNSGVVSADNIIQFMAGVCLYDSPAQSLGRFRYSNFGFTVAGRVMELVTGQNWGTFVPDFMQTNGVWDVTRPGSPLIYQGTTEGDGPPSTFTDPWLQESRYYTHRPDATDVTNAVQSGSSWTFPTTVPAPYGNHNYDVIYAHGGLVANVLALSNYIRRFGITDGLFRPVPWANPGADSQGGRLPGVQSSIRTFQAQPQNQGNPNGAGCLVPDSIATNALNTLNAAPCPIPRGLAVAILFNRDFPNSTDFPSYTDGLHNPQLLPHMIQQALSDIGSTAAEWGSIRPLLNYERQVGCDVKCPADAPFCVPVTCGDGVLRAASEECDDGNNVDGDGCEADCQLPAPPPQQPPGYAGCDGSFPGTCLGGPCAPVDASPSSSQLRDWRSDAHPDGDFSSDTHCFESIHDNLLDWDEAVCVREQHGASDYGVCRECGVDTLVGCICPNDLETDGDCNPGGLGDPVLACIGGRCYPEAPESQPSWMCTARCGTIYGDPGYCLHKAVGDAVCFDDSCDSGVLDTWCNETEGVVCDTNLTCSSSDDPTTPQDETVGCCVPECISTQDCIDRGYVGHVCDPDSQRCVL